MPKYWGKQIFAHRRFPEVDQKQKTEGEKRENILIGLEMCQQRLNGNYKSPQLFEKFQDVHRLTDFS